MSKRKSLYDFSDWNLGSDSESRIGLAVEQEIRAHLIEFRDQLAVDFLPGEQGPDLTLRGNEPDLPVKRLGSIAKMVVKDFSRAGPSEILDRWISWYEGELRILMREKLRAERFVRKQRKASQT